MGQWSCSVRGICTNIWPWTCEWRHEYCAIVYIPRDRQDVVKCSGIVAVAPVWVSLLHSEVAVGGDGFMILLIHLRRSRTMLVFISRCVTMCE